jgi:hypothetical protein
MRIVTVIAPLCTTLVGGVLSSSAFDPGRYLPLSSPALASEDAAQTHSAAAQSESHNSEGLSSKPILAKALRRCRTFPIRCTVKS